MYNDIQGNRSSDKRHELEKSSPLYPVRLRQYEGKWEKLYAVGDISCLDHGVAIIGARKATPYGLKAATLVATWASEMGFTTFSGCARGCDQAAHRASLAVGGKTVAVLGCGADVIYPSNASKLMREIADSGAVVSEYEWGTPPMKYRFVERNRLLAALVDLVVVVEARIPSGTFSTINAAAELGTPVAAVPGSIFCYTCAGPNRLIAEGATVIANREDFLVACSLADLPNPSNRKSQERIGAESKLIEALRAEALTPEEVAHVCCIPVQRAVIAIHELENRGVATRFAGGRFAILTIDGIKG